MPPAPWVEPPPEVGRVVVVGLGVGVPVAVGGRTTGWRVGAGGHVVSGAASSTPGATTVTREPPARPSAAWGVARRSESVGTDVEVVSAEKAMPPSSAGFAVSTYWSPLMKATACTCSRRAAPGGQSLRRDPGGVGVDRAVSAGEPTRRALEGLEPVEPGGAAEPARVAARAPRGRLPQRAGACTAKAVASGSLARGPPRPRSRGSRRRRTAGRGAQLHGRGGRVPRPARDRAMTASDWPIVLE